MKRITNINRWHRMLAGRWHRMVLVFGAGALAASLTLAFIPSEAKGAVPQLINFQGILRDGSGNPVANGPYSVIFTIYDAPTGVPPATNVLWSETQTVTTSGGLFTVLLGSAIAGNEIPDTVFNSPDRYLGIKVGADPEMTPRQKLSSVGYSYVSSQWTSAAQDLFRLNGNVGIGTSAPGAKLDVVASGPYPYAVSATGVSHGVVATGSTVGVYGSSSSGTGTGVYALGGLFGVDATGIAYGVRGISPSGTGVYGNSSSGTGVLAYSSSGPGVVASGGTYGGDFTGTGGGSYGVSATGGGYGGYFTGTGFGSYGVYATGESRGFFGGATSSSSNPTIGCSADAVNTSFGDAYGGFFTGSSTSGTSYGVYGRALSGYGVYGLGGPYGVRGEGSTHGVYGVAHNNGGYGVYGSNGGNSGTWAGYFSGDTHMTGNLEVIGFIFKPGGGFKIDHPTDPANKYLYHSFVESPDMKNIYDGVVTIDAKGEATVTLPDWFGAVNKDFRYQLTCIGGFAPVYVADKIKNNRFRIAGGTPGLEVSWQITGIRQDAYASAHRIPVEEVKSDKERGKYLHPKEQGVSETLGMNYEETQKMEAEQKKMKEQQAKMEAERKQHEEQRAKMEQERLIQEQKIKGNK